jgi:hypothetical protein
MLALVVRKEEHYALISRGTTTNPYVAARIAILPVSAKYHPSRSATFYVPANCTCKDYGAHRSKQTEQMRIRWRQPIQLHHKINNRRPEVRNNRKSIAISERLREVICFKST